MNPGGAGDLTISVGGDLTSLEQAFAQIPQVAEEAFGQVQTAIQSIDWSDVDAGTGALTQGLAAIGEAAAGATPEVEALGEQLSMFASAPLAELPEVGSQLQMFATYAGEATTAVESLGSATASATPSIAALGAATQEADSGLTSLITNLGAGFIAFQLIKTAVEALTTSYGELQQAQLALGALLGNTAQADAAIDSIKSLANAFGVAQDSAISMQQKLVALGEPLANIPRDFQAIADGAAAMNTSFDTAAQRFDQIVNSGSLMARSLTSIGLSTNDVAAAMGQAGVPADLLTTSFKNLDEQQRAAVLSSAELAKNAGVAAAAATGVTAAWTDVKNALQSALAEMGQQVNGFQGLATAATVAIKAIETGFTALMVPINLVGAAIAGLAKTMIDEFSGIGTIISDAFSGNFAKIPDDAKATEEKLQADGQQFLSNVSNDWSQAATGIGKTWQSGMQAVGSSTQAATGQVSAAAGQAAAAMNVLQGIVTTALSKFDAVAASFAAGTVSATAYTSSLNALNTAQENANGGLEQFSTAVLMVSNTFRQQNVDLNNAQTMLGAVGKAMANGEATASQYTSALKALNDAQMTANNGFQNAGTAALMAADAYRTASVAATNAVTNLNVIGQAAQNGTVSWTQYDAALKTVVSTEEDANNGLLSLSTAITVQAEALQTLGVEELNATTQFAAFQIVMGQGAVGTEAYTKALNAMATAQEAVNGGFLTMSTAVLQAQNSVQQLVIAAANSTTALEAQYQEYLKSGQGLDLLIQKTQAYISANQTAQNGILSFAQATAQVGLSITQLNQSIANDNTLLAQAQQRYADTGTGLGLVDKYTKQLKADMDALNGSTTTGVTATQALSSAQVSGTTAANNVATAQTAAAAAMMDMNNAANMATNAYWKNVTAIQGISTAHQQLQTNLQSAVAYLQAVTQAVNDGTASGGQLAAALQAVTAAERALTGSATPAANAIQGLDGTLVQAAQDAAKAAQQITNVGDAASGAAEAVGSLGSELDKLGSGQIGNVSINMTPGQQYTIPNPSTYVSEGTLGDSSGTGIGNPPAGETPFNSTTATYDPSGVTQASTAAATSLNTLSTAATSAGVVTTANTATSNASTSAAMQAAEAQIQFANEMEESVQLGLGNVTKAQADAAEAYAQQLYNSAAGFSGVWAPAMSTGATAVTGVSTASDEASSSLGTLSGNTSSLSSGFTTAGSAVSALATAAQSATNALSNIPGIGAPSSTPPDLTQGGQTYTVGGQQVDYETFLAAEDQQGFAASGIGSAAAISGSYITPVTGAPIVQQTPGFGNDMGSSQRTTAPATQINLTVNNSGTVVGQNGMQQFSNMVGNQIVQSLAQKGIRLNRQ